MSRNQIKNKRQAKKAGLGVFYQKVTEFLAQNKIHELPGVLLGKKDSPVLEVWKDLVIVGIQSDFIRSADVERLPRPWESIHTDKGQFDPRGHGEQLLEVWYKRNLITDKK